MGEKTLPTTYWRATQWDDPQQRTGAVGLGFTIVRGEERVEVSIELTRRLSPQPTVAEFREALQYLGMLFLDMADGRRYFNILIRHENHSNLVDHEVAPDRAVPCRGVIRKRVVRLHTEAEARLRRDRDCALGASLSSCQLGSLRACPALVSPAADHRPWYPCAA
jgi:hypothetical protein